MPCLLPCFAAVLLAAGLCDARGAGRALPVDAEIYVIDAFSKINSAIKWDSTNFLTDTSGNYANCDFAGSNGVVDVPQSTPQGLSITGYREDAPISGSDVDSAVAVVRKLVDNWTYRQEVIGLVRDASSFACSIGLGCRSGRAVLACLFDSEFGGDETLPPYVKPTDAPDGEQVALAFTPQEYDIAEQIIGGVWDRSHFLENLSGYETKCHLIKEPEWNFEYSHYQAKKYGMRIVGLYGNSVNYDDTDQAITEVLAGMKTVKGTGQIGCSVIPDCPDGRGRIIAVVSCLFEV